MRSNNKTKGFTMVELLAVIVVLGILTSIAIAGVQRVLNNARIKYYESTLKEITLAARSYTQDNRKYLPKSTGKSTQISLRQLEQSKYIDNIKDYRKNPCESDTSYVRVFKKGKSDYKYSPYLICPDYKKSETTNKIKPTFAITFNGKNEKQQTTNSNTKTASTKITINAVETQPETEKITIVSYIYRIYSDGKEVFSSGEIQANNKTTLTINKDLTEYVPSNLKIKVTATNTTGEFDSKTESFAYNDVTPPICGDYEWKANDGSYHPGIETPGWLKEAGDSRTIKIKCSDGDGTGCTRDVYTKKFTKETKTATVKIKDNAGLETACTVNVYIDRTAPSVPITTAYKWLDVSTRPTSAAGLSQYTSDTWFSGKVYTEASTSSDATSGFKEYKYTTTGATENERNQVGQTRNIEAEGISTIKYKACDKAGNCSAYNNPITVKLDRTAPTVPTTSLHKYTGDSKTSNNTSELNSYKENTWTNTFVLATADGSTDNLSQVSYKVSVTGAHSNVSNQSSDYKNIRTEGTSYVSFKACDEAGNCSLHNEPKTLLLDLTNPTVSVRGNYQDGRAYDGAWINQYLVRNIDYADAGGSGWNRVEFSTDNGKSWHKEEHLVNHHATEIPKADYSECFRSIDNAGNVSGSKCWYPRIDITPPLSPKITKYELSTSSLASVKSENCTSAGGTNSHANCTVEYQNSTAYWYDTTKEYTDNLSGIREVQYYWNHDGPEDLKCAYWSSAECGSWKTAGAYNLWSGARAIDNAGNIGYQTVEYHHHI